MTSSRIRWAAGLALLAAVAAGCSAGHPTGTTAPATPAPVSHSASTAPKPPATPAKPPAAPAKPSATPPTTHHRATPTPAPPAPTTAHRLPDDNGGDHDADNNGGPDDGDGNI